MSSNTPDAGSPAGEGAQEKSEREKTLEMRVAELEDKLSKMYFTEEEFRAYQKVSSVLARRSFPRGLGGSANAMLLVDICGPWALGIILPLLGKDLRDLTSEGYGGGEEGFGSFGK